MFKFDESTFNMTKINTSNVMNETNPILK